MKPSEPDKQDKQSKRDKQSKPGEECKPNELPLPLFVPLASFARYRRNLAGNAPAHERTLAHFLSHHLISKQADFDLPIDFFVNCSRTAGTCSCCWTGWTKWRTRTSAPKCGSRWKSW